MNYSNLKNRAYEANAVLKSRYGSMNSFAHVTVVDRLNGVFAIQPNSFIMGSLKVRDMVIMNLDGSIIEGEKPADDALTHAILYSELPDINAITSSHALYTAGWAQAKRAIPIYGIGHSMHMPCDVPITEPFDRHHLNDNYYKAVGQAIIKLFLPSEVIISGMSLGNVVTESAYIKTESALKPLEVPMVLVAGDGSYAWGATAHDAVRHSALLEDIAKRAYITEQLNSKITRLDEHIIEQQFKSKHKGSNYFVS